MDKGTPTRNRFVKVTRNTKLDGSPGSAYFRPVELRNGSLYPLGNALDLDHELGYDDMQDAWRVIDAIEEREHPERCDCKTCRPELYR